MKLLKLRNITFIATIALTAFFITSVKAANTVSYPSTPLTISLVNPMQSQVIVSSGLTFSGKAPSGVIVTLTIQDEDYQKAFQAHEENLIINGTTTSDRNGDWIYVPSKNLIPGRYSVVAAFQNNTSGSISTEKVFFTIADESGATSWFAIPGGTIIAIIFIAILALLILIFKLSSTKTRKVMLHTTSGDIPVREIIDENNNVEIVPLTEPVINLSMQPNAFVIQSPSQTAYAQPAYNQQMPLVQPQQQIIQPIIQPVIQPVIQQPVVAQPIVAAPILTTQQGMQQVQANVTQQIQKQLQQNQAQNPVQPKTNTTALQPAVNINKPVVQNNQPANPFTSTVQVQKPIIQHPLMQNPGPVIPNAQIK